MAIVFNCLYCKHLYRLKDEFAGRRAQCKNPSCRRLITIPPPSTSISDADLDALALNALSDDMPTMQEAPSTEKVISMTCDYCGHGWTVPWEKAGKNTLCPNPECRQRVRVPEPKEDKPHDWRQKKSNLPTLAKANFEKPADVQDASDSKYVGAEALKKADATGEEIEPRTLKQKLTIGLLIVGPIAVIAFAIWLGLHARTSGKEDWLMVKARQEFDASKSTMNPGEAGLSSALLYMAAAEYALRHDETKKLQEAYDSFVKARAALPNQPSSSLERSAVVTELAALVLSLGGSDEQVKERIRYPWEPQQEVGNRHIVKMNEELHSVFQELGKTLILLNHDEFEFKILLARRLTHDLAKRGQADLAAKNLPLSLFSQGEQDEAQAVIALEIHRLDPKSQMPQQMANQLLKPGGKAVAPTPSVQTLSVILPVGKAPPIIRPLSPLPHDVGDDVRIAHVGCLLLQDKPKEALELAQRPGGSHKVQLKALVLCADWSADPAPALVAAQAWLPPNKGRPGINQFHILRLSQIAAETGKGDAKMFADALTDEGLKAWARGEIAHLRIATNPKEKADEGWIEIPTDPMKQMAGHAWGRLWVARQNALLSGNRKVEQKAADAWPPTIRPFGLAGIALGLQDK